MRLFSSRPKKIGPRQKKFLRRQFRHILRNDIVMNNFSEKVALKKSQFVILGCRDRKGLLLVVSRKPSSLSSHPFKVVVDERIRDGQPPRADPGVRVHLLENLVDVGRVRLALALIETET